MHFYDNYVARSKDITRIGKLIITRQVRNHINLIKAFRNKESIKVLELGPGKGYFARAVLEIGWIYQAVDGSHALVDMLREAGIKITEAFVPPIPNEAGTGYDLILMEHFIEHMDSPTHARNLVEAVHKILLPGGLIFIVSPDYLEHRENFWDCDYTHSFVTTSQRLRQLLIDSGFEISYDGYETLGFQDEFSIWLISFFARLAFACGIPQLASLVLKEPSVLSNKWKNILFRSCVVVGKRL